MSIWETLANDPKVICGTLFSVLVIYLLSKCFRNPNKNLWKDQGIKEVPRNLFGILNLFRKPFHVIQEELYRKHGRVYGTFEWSKPSLIVNDPELLKTILAKDFHKFPNRRRFKVNDSVFDKALSALEGEDWKRVRTIISPTFSTGKIRHMSNSVIECVQSLLNNMESNLDKTIDIKPLFGAYTMDVIGSCAFGVKLDSHKDPDNPFVKMARKIFTPKFSFSLLFLLILPLKVSQALKLRLGDREAIGFFESATRNIIKLRKTEKNQDKNDFLQLLIDAQTNLDGGRGKTLSEDEMIAQCILFFLAGYDTTANALTYSSYNLAMNPEKQSILYKEIDDAWRIKNELDFDTIMKLPYLDAVINETLRVHTIAGRIERIATEDATVDTIKIPKGTIIGAMVSSMHMDEEFFPEASKFKPERFLPENKDQIQPYSYLPFGAGPRNCVGLRFALMEVKFALAMTVHKFEFVATDESKAGLKFLNASGLLQAQKVPVKIVKRT